MYGQTNFKPQPSVGLQAAAPRVQ